MILGIDFDNTLVSYDQLFHRLALEAGLVTIPRKSAVREAARRSSGGEILWQRLQAEAYGPRILEAMPMEGALAFLRRATVLGHTVHVISHKTSFAAQDPGGTNLQAAALGWLQSSGFLGSHTSLSPERVHFGQTRAEKLQLIRSLGCTHFIDDLHETFSDHHFPAEVKGYLFDPEGPHSWPALQKELLGG